MPSDDDNPSARSALAHRALADPALISQLRGGDVTARRSAVQALVAARPRAEATWVAVAWVALENETDPEVASDLVRLLGSPDGAGTVPLELHLEAGGPAARRSAMRPLQRVLDDPGLFAATFGGITNPHRRALAATFHEMGQTDPAHVSGAISRCVYAREPHVQRAGLAALMEVPEEVARPILAQFPEELALPESADIYREVNATFETRRTFRNLSLPYYPLRCLGQGGMGAVWLARDLKRPPRLAALKILKAGPDGQHDPELLTRFEREARVPLLLNHPGLVRVFDFGKQTDFHWIDEDFIQGHNLQEVLDREARLDWPNTVWIAMQVADALDYLHRKRIVHRDLKPANLFIARDPHRVVLGDFGLVFIGDDQLQAEIPNYARTQATLILGTVGYMSPEQATSSALDGRSDLFSLGALMYRMLSGRLPFGAGSYSEYLRGLTGGRAPDPLDSATPRALNEVVMKLLERAPEDRLPAASALVDTLRTLSIEAAETSLTGLLRAPMDADPSTLASVTRPMGLVSNVSGRITGRSRSIAMPPPAAPRPPEAAPHPPEAAPAPRLDRTAPSLPAWSPHSTAPTPPAPAAPGVSSGVHKRNPSALMKAHLTTQPPPMRTPPAPWPLPPGELPELGAPGEVDTRCETMALSPAAAAAQSAAAQSAAPQSAAPQSAAAQPAAASLRSRPLEQVPAMEPAPHDIPAPSPEPLPLRAADPEPGRVIEGARTPYDPLPPPPPVVARVENALPDAGVMAPGPVSNATAAFLAGMPGHVKPGGAPSGVTPRPSTNPIGLKRPPPKPRFDPPPVSTPPPLSPEAQAAEREGSRPPSEGRGWCPTCRVDTESALEGCISCRYVMVPWPPWILQWGLALLALYFVAPVVLERIPQAPHLPAPFGTRMISGIMGVGFFSLGLGLSRMRNWAYVTGAVGVWLVALAGGGAAAAISRATLDRTLSERLAMLVRLGFAESGQGPEFVLRLLKEQYQPRLAVVAGGAFLLAVTLVGAESRETFRRNWNARSLGGTLVTLALILGPVVYAGYAHWHNLPL